MNQKLKRFLQNTKLTAETISALAPALKVLLVIVVAVVLLMMFNTARAEKREQEYIEQMRVFKQQAENAIVYADSLRIQIAIRDSIAEDAKKQADKAQSQANRSKVQTAVLTGRLDSLRRTITDSVEMARVIIPKQDTIIEQQNVTIKKQDEQIVFLGVALEEKNTALIISNHRGDSLQTVVSNIPTPPEPPRIPKITRKQAFTAGTVIGAVGAYLILK